MDLRWRLRRAEGRAALELNEFVGIGYCDLGQMTASPRKAVALHRRRPRVPPDEIFSRTTP